jgi:putative protease
VRIVAPVSSTSEVEMLLHHGADELYCGLTTAEWETRFGHHLWMNRRSSTRANLSSWQEIEEVVNLAHRQGVAVHMALNAPFYTDDALAFLLELCRKAVEKTGIDSIIVSDINLLVRLASEALPVRIHLSSLGSFFNARSAEFYHSLGVRRIILPRQLGLSDIRRVVAASGSDMEFEVFALNDGCYFEEGFCRTSHSLGPFCLAQGEPSIHGSPPDGISPALLAEGMKDLQEYLWTQNNCGSSFQADGLPNGPCSLCRFGHFRDWGVHAVKIVGREASFVRKLGSIQLVKAVMDEARKGAGREEIARLSRSLRKSPELCHKGFMCYFRE